MADSSTADDVRVRLHVPAQRVFAIDDAGVEHALPAHAHTPFRRALDIDARAAALAARTDADDDAAVAQRTERQWTEVYQAGVQAREEVAHGMALVDTLLARRHLAAEHLPEEAEPTKVEAQREQLAVASTQAHLKSAAQRLLRTAQSLRAQLANDRRHWRQIQTLAQNWHLRGHSSGGLLITYGGQERAACVRVHRGHVALRLPAQRASALGRRIAVWHGSEKLTTLHGPAPPAERTERAFGVAHCDATLRRARQSFWLQRLFQQLLVEASAHASDAAYLADDWLASELRVVCIALSLADAAPAISLAFQLESPEQVDSESDVRSAAHADKRRRTALTGAVALSPLPASALQALTRQLDRVMSRLCVGVDELRHARELQLRYDAPVTQGFVRDQRIDSWLADDARACASRARRASADASQFAAYFQDISTQKFSFPEDGKTASLPPLSYVAAVRTLWDQCLAKVTVDAIVAVLQNELGDAFAVNWMDGKSPFVAEATVVLGGESFGRILLVDGIVRRAFSDKSMPEGVELGTVDSFKFAIRQNASRLAEKVSSIDDLLDQIDEACEN